MSVKIIVLHRISNKKLQYEQVLCHREHEVIYLCLSKADASLPPYARCIVIPGNHFDEALLVEQYEHLLRSSDVLIARSEFDLIVGARLRERFGICGEHTKDVMPYRNKLMMRELADQAGIVQPDFFTVSEFSEREGLTGLFVLKPHSEAASNGIVVGHISEIQQAIAQLTAPSSYLVERFTTGNIWHIDGWRYQGEVQGCVPSLYLGNCLEHAEGAPLGSIQQPLTETLLTLTQNILDALGGSNGSFHLELIEVEAGHYHFLEVASRVGGAGVAQTFALRTGVNLYHVDLCLALGQTITYDVLTDKAPFYGWFVYTPTITPQKRKVEAALKHAEPHLHSYTYTPNYVSFAHQNSYAEEANLLTGVTVGSVEQMTNTLDTLFKFCERNEAAA
ncbi:acetyl-CoA carboxylase biotin carboxylase subunit family protein [Vibrio sp. 10N.261.46.E11]|uniref:ATP-grasp domain-containing protein n=1 Tax=Vibrio sp. 10N.261.46.E11 TaxID=3229662 RepID=UPI00354F105F